MTHCGVGESASVFVVDYIRVGVLQLLLVFVVFSPIMITRNSLALVAGQMLFIFDREFRFLNVYAFG